ncbi:hypothetical protein EV360DRAFT_74585 [Lentinula raphanica]|nr:hypothetical protein EV360DRAFT_74585 [Lentinula raphanica]
MQLFSRTKNLKGLRRAVFVALLFSAISLAVPINPEVDSESNESTHSLSTSQEPVFHDIVSRSPRLWPRQAQSNEPTRPLSVPQEPPVQDDDNAPADDDQQPLLSQQIEARVKSNHADTDSVKDNKVQQALKTMLNTKTFFKRMQEVVPDIYKKQLKLEALSVKLTEFGKDPNTNPLYRLKQDKGDRVNDEDYQLRISLTLPASGGKPATHTIHVFGYVQTASLTVEGGKLKFKGKLWGYIANIVPYGGQVVSRDVWVNTISSQVISKLIEYNMQRHDPIAKKVGRAALNFMASGTSFPVKHEPYTTTADNPMILPLLEGQAILVLEVRAMVQTCSTS